MKYVLHRPGLMLFIVGVVAFFGRKFVGWVPLIGGVLGFMLLAFGLFAMVGGAFVMIKGPKAEA